MRVRTQKGFTLIELVMVIVILGILAAVVIPQYVNLSGEANRAAVQGVAGSMASAVAINFSTRLLTSAPGTIRFTSCDNATLGAILQGGVPSGYTVWGATGLTSGQTGTCFVSNASYSSVPFVGIGTSQ